MFDLNRAIIGWRKSLQKSPDIQETDLAELESHLRDEIEARIERGLDPEAAFRTAAADSAPAAELGVEFELARLGGRRRSFLSPARFLSASLWKSILFGFRKMRRTKGQAALQVGGLAIGLAAFALIMLYVRYERSYDTFHVGAERIFRVAFEITLESTTSGAIVPAPLAPFLLERLPEIRTATRVVPQDPILLRSGERGIRNAGIFADAGFFKVFSFPLRRGTPEQALSDLDSIVLSRALAEKLFGREDPLGRILSCSLGDFKVTGILEDIPENSHFRFEWIIPLDRRFSPDRRAEQMGRWNMDDYFTYLVLDERAEARTVESKMAPLLRDQYRNLARTSGKDWWNIRAGIRYFLQPLKSIHLESHTNYELQPNGNLKAVRLFAAVAFLILLIAGINAVQLTMARAGLRFREVGVRKSLGAGRGQLLCQFLGEAQLASTAALAAAVGLVGLALPLFRRLTGKPLVLEGLLEGTFPLLLIMTAILTGLFSGLFPAVRMSAIPPLSALRRDRISPRRGFDARKILVIVQFGLTIALVAGGLVVFKQIRFIRTRDIGYDRAGIIQVRAVDAAVRGNREALIGDLKGNPEILSVSSVSQPLVEIGAAGGRPLNDDAGHEIRMHFYFTGVDYNFADFAGIEIVQGRNFSPERSTDSQTAVLVNEAFVSRAGWAAPVGKRIDLLEEGVENDIVGVVRDFHFRSMREEIEPLVMTCAPNSSFVLVRARPGRIPEALGAVREAYKTINPGIEPEAVVLDEVFDRLYSADAKLGWMLTAFSVLAVLLSAFGILGLAAAMAERRTKEIGVRRVLGASTAALCSIMLRDFLRAVLLANVFAWPVAFFIMNDWLNNFTYRTRLGLGAFIASALIALAVALLTAGGHTLKAASANPIQSLRNE